MGHVVGRDVVLVALCGSWDYADCGVKVFGVYGFASLAVGIIQGLGSPWTLRIEGESVIVTNPSLVTVSGQLACYIKGFSETSAMCVASPCGP